MRIVCTASFICAFNADALAEPAVLTPTNPSGIQSAFNPSHALVAVLAVAVAVAVDPDDDGSRSHPTSATNTTIHALRIRDTVSRFRSLRAPCYFDAG